MALADVPPGTVVTVAALPHLRGTVVRHGAMATVLRLEEPVEAAGKTLTRKVTVLWSGRTEVVPA